MLICVQIQFHIKPQLKTEYRKYASAEWDEQRFVVVGTMFLYYFRAKNAFESRRRRWVPWTLWYEWWPPVQELLCACCVVVVFFFTALRGRLISVHRRVEAQQSPNKHGLEEKTIDFCECALIRLSLSLSLPLCSLKALVSTGGKNVQAACDWWEQRILSLPHLLMRNRWWRLLTVNITHTHRPDSSHCIDVSPGGLYQCCPLQDVGCPLSLSLSPHSFLTPPLGLLVCRSRLFSHVDDPFLDDPLPREYVLYLRPSGQLLQHLSTFWQQSRLSCGKNKAHNIFPHITLCQFFMVSVNIRVEGARLYLRRQLRKARTVIGRHIYHH